LLVAPDSLSLGEAAEMVARNPPRPEIGTMLIEPEELQNKLREPGLRILDVRPQPDYDKDHIPGAVHVSVKAWQQLGSKEGGLHDAKAWSDRVGQLGIGKETHVAVYGSSLPDAARVWWTLKYVGVPNVTLLDGGWDLWRKQMRPTATESPRIDAAHFQPDFQADRLQEMNSLGNSLHGGQVKLIDARSAKEFTGEEVRGKRGGHIPGATHLEWKELLAADGRFKSARELRELFHKRGIDPSQAAVTC
jgi:thiosulfate/3-mercaptopyruvate sulfurtransferase